MEKNSKKAFKKQKVICTYHHFDFQKFGVRKDFYDLDQYVDEYHVVSELTKDQLRGLTEKNFINSTLGKSKNMV